MRIIDSREAYRTLHCVCSIRINANTKKVFRNIAENNICRLRPAPRLGRSLALPTPSLALSTPLLTNPTPIRPHADTVPRALLLITNYRPDGQQRMLRAADLLERELRSAGTDV